MQSYHRTILGRAISPLISPVDTFYWVSIQSLVIISYHRIVLGRAISPLVSLVDAFYWVSIQPLVIISFLLPAIHDQPIQLSYFSWLQLCLVDYKGLWDRYTGSTFIFINCRVHFQSQISGVIFSVKKKKFFSR